LPVWSSNAQQFHFSWCWTILISIGHFSTESNVNCMITSMVVSTWQGYVQGSIQRISLPQEPVQQQGGGATSFALQLVQRGLEETLGSVQQAIHEDVQNLHLELLRQFHIQQVLFCSR
jgi:hypothetical protein